ncbi:unnamed protein product [Caenorhabditis brenneri]
MDTRRNPSLVRLLSFQKTLISRLLLRIVLKMENFQSKLRKMQQFKEGPFQSSQLVWSRYYLNKFGFITNITCSLIILSLNFKAV